MQRRQLLQGAAGAVLAPAGWAVHAQAPAGGPVRIVIGFAAGGGVDALARLVAERLKDALGRQVIVENKTGAAGRLAVEAVKAAAPDGDMLLIAPQGPMTLFPYVYRNLRFDPSKDFTPLSRLVVTDFCLAVGAELRVTDVAGFKRWALAAGGKVSYGTPGAGTIPHFLGVQIAHGLGIEMTHVPYRGGAPAVLDLAAGTVSAAVVPISDPLELHKAGKVKILATTGALRSKLVNGIPTLKESGIDLDVTAWYGLYGPAGMAPDVARKLQAAVASSLKEPGLQERLAKIGLVTAPSTAAELLAQQQAELAMWGPVVKASGFSPED
jgi:tripartite-type tricarboxylate transporter receptor subunit TctC